MFLYYVHDKSHSYRLAVQADNWWNARFKAREWMLKTYDVDVPIHEWNVNLCDNNVIIE